VSLLKANLSRHTPSRGVLQAVQASARRLATAVSPSSGGGADTTL
jgi:hypothetical protein